MIDLPIQPRQQTAGWHVLRVCFHQASIGIGFTRNDQPVIKYLHRVHYVLLSGSKPYVSGSGRPYNIDTLVIEILRAGIKSMRS